MRARFAIIVLAMAVFCACAVAQETAEDWYKKGQGLYMSQSPQEAVGAFDRAIELNQSMPWPGGQRARL